MASVNQNRMAASRRLMKDLEEMKKFPVENISAVPLDDNLFEWHCCVVVSDVNFHVILYFPDNYPNSGPSADFFPIGLRISSGASEHGKKGMKFCLNFLTDYNHYHQEWQKDVGYGWSPSCTIQILLLNICAALSEYRAVELNEELLKDASLSCADCGHTCNNPFPPLPQVAGHASHISDDKPEISCYISRDTFSESKKPETKEEVFGFGLEVRGNTSQRYLASPCETLTFGSFQRMMESLGFVQTSIKEEVTQFLPLFIHPNHGECIKDLFEETVDELCKGRKRPRGMKSEYTMADRIIDVLPNLMATTVEDYTVALEGNANLLNGFFAVHRLLLWACETYPGLQETIDQRIQDFIEGENSRHKKNCPRTEEWLMLLTVTSNKYRWEDVAELYVTEVWNRTVFNLVSQYRELVEKQDLVSTATVLQKVFELTAALNKRIALQVVFLTVACPMGLRREDIMRRYDNNLGLPTNEMMDEVKEGLKSARGSQSFADWFKIWKFAPISDEEIRLRLVESVQFSISTAGYRTNTIHLTGWRPSINKWKSGKDMSIRKKLVMHTSIPVVQVPELSKAQMPTKSPSKAEVSMSQGTSDHVSSPSATCSEKVDQSQGPQPMDTSESSNSMEEKLNTNLDNAPSPRPNLWPSMTVNSLADLRENRHLQIFRSSSDVSRPRRIKSCCVF